MTEAKPELLNNRYQLVDLIGKGAMGRVYKARDTRLGGALVAVKVLSKALLSDKMGERFRNEARICAQLGQKSIHIVRVSDYDFDSDGVPYYVMEYLQGDGLSDIVRRQPLSLNRFVSMMRQICLGIQCAHQGIDIDGILCPIIHRDIKPSNMLVMQDQSIGELVKVLDFGISKVLQEDANQTSTFMGTMVYSSPEQMEGRELDARSDIYSLGVMMFEMLTGQIPLQAETHTFAGWYRAHTTQAPRSMQAVLPHLQVPPVITDLVMGCLAKNAAHRPQSVIDILKILEPLEQAYASSAPTPNPGRSGTIPAPVAPNPVVPRQMESMEDSTVPKGLPSRMTVSAIDELYSQATWPQDKPIAAITFSQPLEVCQRRLPLVWAMLPHEEIQMLKMHQLYSRIYKNVLCLPAPHPMALWTTALYNKACHVDREPRWFSHYLDLTQPQGRETLSLLGERGKYHLILFAQENPKRPSLILEMPVTAQLQSSLQEWSILSSTWRSVSDAATSKGILRTELDKMKQRVNQELMPKVKRS